MHKTFEYATNLTHQISNFSHVLLCAGRNLLGKEISMKIVVGYDGSGAAKNALDVAKRHARAFGAKVYILTSMVKGTERQIGGHRKSRARS